jgi:hypothetical protein
MDVRVGDEPSGLFSFLYNAVALGVGYHGLHVYTMLMKHSSGGASYISVDFTDMG